MEVGSLGGHCKKHSRYRGDCQTEAIAKACASFAVGKRLDAIKPEERFARWSPQKWTAVPIRNSLGVSLDFDVYTHRLQQRDRALNYVIPDRWRRD